MTFRSILCPVDFSPPSRVALQVASGLARRYGSHVTILFVNDPLLLAAATRTYGSRRFADRTKAELARFVKRAASTKSDDVELVVSAGNPAEEILHHAKRARAGLVVMGSHGLSGIPKALFGSTTEQVLRRVNVPVLAIPPAFRVRTMDFPAQVTSVIAPIDLTGEWRSDAVRAATIAGQLDAHLTLVHVLAPVNSPPWLGSISRSSERRRLHKARAALDRVRTKLFSDLESVSALVLVGNPAHEVARLTKSAGGALVVMSLRGTAGVWGLRRGAIAYHLLMHAKVPVLALPRRRIGGRLSARARTAIGDILSARDRIEMAGIDALLSLGSRRKPVKR